MPKFRKKPVVIEAFDTSKASDAPDWLLAALNNGTVWYDSVDGRMRIRTLEGVHEAGPGDWIIQGVKGELYPCKPDIFAATYEAAE